MELIDKVKERKENLTKRQDLIEGINPIVEKAFGKEFRGDCRLEYEGWSYGKELSKIARERKISSWEVFWRVLTLNPGSPWAGLETAGDFYNNSSGKEINRDERDGSVITVKPQYRTQAEEYARLYEQRFGKEVTIRIDDKIV